MRRKTLEGDLYESENYEWVVAGTTLTVCKPPNKDVPRIFEPEEEFGFAEEFYDKSPVGTDTVDLIEFQSDLYFDRPVTDPDRLTGRKPRTDRPYILTREDGEEVIFEVTDRTEFSVLGLDALGDSHIPDEVGVLVNPSGAHKTLIAEAELAAAIEAGRVVECVPAHVQDRYHV